MSLVCSYWVGPGAIEIGLGLYSDDPWFLFFNVSLRNSRIGVPESRLSWCCAKSLKCEVF